MTQRPPAADLDADIDAEEETEGGAETAVPAAAVAEEPPAKPKPPLSESMLHMWRCIIAVAQADGQVGDAELDYLGRVIAGLHRDYAMTAEQSAILGEDMVPPACDVSKLLPYVTDANDRAELFYFGALMAKEDGEIQVDEEVLLRKIGAGFLSEGQMKDYIDEARRMLNERKVQEALAAHQAALAAQKAGALNRFRGAVQSLLAHLAIVPPDTPQR